MTNIFRGKIDSSQVFPYPHNLNDEEKETLSMVIDPLTRFFTVSPMFIYFHQSIT